MLKESKEVLFSKINNVCSEFPVLYCMSFDGVNARDFDVFRAALFEVGAGVFIVKKSLFRLALSSGLEVSDMPDMDSKALLLVYSKDPVSSAKCISEYVKVVKEDKMSFIFGYFNRSIISKNDFVKISTLPSKEILYASLLNAILAVPRKFVSDVAGVPSRLILLLSKVANSDN